MTKEELLEENKRLVQMNLILVKMLGGEEPDRIIYVDKYRDKINQEINRQKRMIQTFKQFHNMIDLEISEIKLEMLEELLDKEE